MKAADIDSVMWRIVPSVISLRRVSLGGSPSGVLSCSWYHCQFCDDGFPEITSDGTAKKSLSLAAI
jgi:hypothetical protein